MGQVMRHDSSRTVAQQIMSGDIYEINKKWVDINPIAQGTCTSTT